MYLLAAGLVLFAALHFLPVIPLARERVRAPLVASMGLVRYRLRFSILALAGVVLMVVGWLSAEPVPLYDLPAGFARIGEMAAFLGVVVFLSSSYPSRVRRAVRHPQLVGTALWGAGHLLFGGDSRSVVLFGGLALWALVSMAGGWERVKATEPVPAPLDLLFLSLILVAAAVAAWAHALVAGGILSL